MSDLASWLLEQIAEDELVANRYVDHLMAGCKRGFAFEDLPFPVRRQVLEWSPQRVLAECEAKRGIVEAYLTAGRRVHDDDQMPEGSEWILGRRHGAWRAVQLTALCYADRPGYREEWRP